MTLLPWRWRPGCAVETGAGALRCNPALQVCASILRGRAKNNRYLLIFAGKIHRTRIKQGNAVAVVGWDRLPGGSSRRGRRLRGYGSGIEFQ